MIRGLCLHYLNSDLEKKLLESGAEWIRSDIGTSAWDEIYRFAKSNGIKLIGILDYNIVGDNFTLDDWKTAVENAVKKYDCEAYEIWNEPFADYSKKGYQDGSWQHYVKLVNTASGIIRMIRPTSKIIGGGGIYDGEEKWAENVIPYISSAVDLISLHIYWNIPSWLSWLYKYFYGWYVKNEIEKFSRIINKQLIVTESGLPFTQCEWMSAVDSIRETVIWYEFQDGDGQFGILDKNGGKKDSFKCFADIMSKNKVATDNWMRRVR